LAPACFIGFANGVFVSLQLRSFFATKRLRGSFLTNEKRMNENLVEARSTPWTRPNN
jgi:hypothetical protein